MEKEQRYINVLFSDETIEKIDDFRFKNRFPSRTEAIRFLVQWALSQKPSVKKEKQ